MAYYAGDEITTFITLIDASSVPITGATFTQTAIDPSGNTFSTVILEISPGVYRIRFTAATAGAYYLKEVYDNGSDPIQTFEQVFDVDSGGNGSNVSILGTPTINRRDLRLRIGRRLGDVTVLRATSDAGDINSIIDAVSISVAADNLVGRQFICVTGDNTGHIARITGTTESSGFISFTPPATVPYVTGDVVHVFNKNSRGWTVDEYNDAITAAIQDAYPRSLVEIMADITPDFDTETGEFEVPEDFVEVFAIESQDTFGTWHRVKQAQRMGGYGWSGNPGQGTIRISDSPGWLADDTPLRIWGYGRHADVTSDTDYTTLNPEWLVARACYHLLLGGMDRDATRSSQVLIYRDESVAWMTRIRTIRTSRSVKIR